MSNTGRITILRVEAMQAGELLWDADVKGFGVRCQRRDKVYVLKARIKGRARWFSIGPHGSPWTPETARKKAKAMLGAIEDGVDLALIREEERRVVTMKQLCERYLTDYAAEHKQASSIAADRRNIDNHILPLLGKLNVRDVTRADIDRFKRFVKDGKTARDQKRGHRSRSIVTGGAGAANRCLALLSKLFNLAELWGERPDNSNPCRHVGKYQESRRGRLLSAEELARLGTVLREADIAWEKFQTLSAERRVQQDHARSARHSRDRAAAKLARDRAAACAAAMAQLETPVSPYATGAIRLLTFTGARLSEILDLQWGWIDFESAEARLPRSKTGAKTLHLPPPAMEVLRTLPKVKGNPFVIVGQVEGAALVNLQKPWRFIRQKAGLEDVRLHDLRHAFASIAAASGMGLPIIGKMLGHSQAATTARYAHLANDPVKSAAAAVAGTIAAAMGGGTAEIVTLQKRNA